VSVSKEVEVEIRRLHFGEHWPVGTVATQLKVHVDVVKRVLGLLESRPSSALRPRAIDAYVAFIDETLEKYPTLRSTRLFDMLAPRGYAGSVRSLREYVATVRPRPLREAYLRVEPLVGEQAQVDWAYVGKVKVPGGERPLWLFVYVLSWSRAAWGEFVFDTTVHSLLRSLSRAAAYFSGCTRQWLFDNPKTVVLERHGDAARFHPLLLELSGSYCVSLRLCAPRKANQKGRVERAIRYWRERFLAGRTIRSIEQGNRELLAFLDETANARPHPTQTGRTVAECLADEQQRLLPLPKSPPPTDLVQPVGIDKTAFVRFDTNDYSVPHEHAERRDALTLVADDVTVRFLHGGVEVTRHARSWGRRQVVENMAHRQALLEAKRGAQEAKGQDRLRAAVPGIDVLFERWVHAGRNVGSLIARTVPLLDVYGEDIVRQAVGEVLAGTTHDHHAVAVVCDRLRREASKPVPLDVPLGDHVPDRDVIPHSLESYDVRPKRRA
jgi:transposase